jgi:hypothetical protein
MVPSSLCRTCDVCCRFPDKESLLAPYFTEEEISAAVQAGISEDNFPDRRGSKIRLIPYQEGYVCPCFSPEENRCTVYPSRPTDCRIYPFALMRTPDNHGIQLGMDTKCPFVRDEAHRAAMTMSSGAMIQWIASSPAQDLLEGHEGIVNPWQDDVVPLKTVTP